MNELIYLLFLIFILLGFIYIGIWVFQEKGSQNKGIWVESKICPKGCKKGKCLHGEKCLHCDPSNPKCCCDDSQCENCSDVKWHYETIPEGDWDLNKKIMRENQYIEKLNKKILNINKNINDI